MKNFAIGFISKEKVLNLITLKKFIKPHFTYYKLLLIIFTVLSIYLLSFIRIKRLFNTNNSYDLAYLNKSSIDIKNSDFSIIINHELNRKLFVITLDNLNRIKIKY